MSDNSTSGTRRPERIVLVGYGPVGSRFVEELLPLVRQGVATLTVVGAESADAYNWVLIAEYAVGNADRASLEITDTVTARDAGVHLRLRARGPGAPGRTMSPRPAVPSPSMPPCAGATVSPSAPLPMRPRPAMPASPVSVRRPARAPDAAAAKCASRRFSSASRRSSPPPGRHPFHWFWPECYSPGIS